MGIFNRLFARRQAPPTPTILPRRREETVRSAIFKGGSHDLEVVGESHYQDALWNAVGSRTTERVRLEIRAILLAEADNPYDPNAISVWIQDARVGYLSREDAAAYRPGLLALQAAEGRSVGLHGVIVGGGIRQDGPGFLGVWMWHEPADFGIAAVVPPPTSAMRATMRTGLTEALLTDEQDDSYDLSWLHRLPSEPAAAIKRLRQLLIDDPDPIDRHFMFCELEERLYRSRDAFSSALDEYDEACTRHDAEMDGIRDALLAKFGKVPLLDTYRQMSVRQQKAQNWQQAHWWAERGLTLYGQTAARPEAVDDLQKRAAAYRAKMAGRPKPSAAAPPPRVSVEQQSTEALVCATCGASFQRTVVRGRKPTRCPSCR